MRGSVMRGSRFARFVQRWRAMTGIALAMMFHDKAKLAGGLVGVLFATVLSGQQAATFLGLIDKNTMLLRHTDAAIWVVPLHTEQLVPGKKLPERVLHQARATEGVAWASPLVWTMGNISLPQGGSEQIQILGVDTGAWRGVLPWNVVAGERQALAQPDAIFVEDADREKFGGLNLGSVREINGKRVQVVGLHWGLMPFGPSYAFASADTARAIGGMTDRGQHMVLVGVAPGQDAAAVAARLRTIDGVSAYTEPEYRHRVVKWLLTRTPIGITFGTGALFGLIVGFVIVGIAMFGSVVDNIREFGTLKAIGVTNHDLGKLLFIQSIIYGAIGSGVGLVLVWLIARAIKSPNLALSLPPLLFAIVPAVMILICIGASSLALLRLRKVEPGIVFRA